MTAQEPSEKDDLAGLFELRPAAGGFAAMQGFDADRATLARTLAIVRRHGVRRRLRFGASLLALVVAAFLAGRSTAPALAGSRPATDPAPEHSFAGRGAPASPAVPEIEAEPAPGALLGMDLGAAAAVLKQRGDRLLNERADLDGALDCYRQHLEIVVATRSLRAAADDSWLLAKLKDARLKEIP